MKPFDWAEDNDSNVLYWPIGQSELGVFEEEAVNNALNSGEPLVQEIYDYLDQR